MNNMAIMCSIAILLLALIGSILIPIVLKGQYNIKRIYPIIAGVFLSVLAIMLHADYQPNVHGSKTTFPLAFLHTMQIMLVGYNFSDLYSSSSLF